VTRAAALAIAALSGAALLGPAACGGEDSQTVEPPPRAERADLYGTWTATQPGGYRLRYVFRPDGTYEHSSIVRQKERGGRSSFRIAARGTVAVRGSTLTLRPRSGTKRRRDTSDPGGDYTRPIEKFPQRYEWSVRGTGPDARLTLAIGSGLGVTYQRR
jgi:hypothetical protein